MRSLIVHAGQGETGRRGLAAAFEIAAVFNAEVIGLAAERLEPPMPRPFAYLDEEGMKALGLKTATDLDAARARFEAVAAGRPSRFLAVADPPLQALTEAGWAADLAVVARAGPTEPQPAVDPADLVMAFGGPVMVAPPGPSPFALKTVLIAWKATRECRRAVNASLPFLRRAARIVILEIRGDGGDEADTPAPGLAALKLRLEAHGLACEIRSAQREFKVSRVALQIEGAAAEEGADLLVVGAYGQPRLKEWVFGGVTEDLLRESARFVLFSP